MGRFAGRLVGGWEGGRRKTYVDQYSSRSSSTKGEKRELRPKRKRLQGPLGVKKRSEAKVVLGVVEPEETALLGEAKRRAK